MEPPDRIPSLNCMKHLSLPIAALLLGACAPALADPTPEHAALCVAALQSEAEGLAQQFRDGKVEIEPQLVRRVEQGFAFIGSAYKRGVRNEEANRLLKAAQEAQQGLPAPELAARQAACRIEGAELLAKANALERAFVSQAAQRRVDKLKRAS